MKSIAVVMPMSSGDSHLSERLSEVDRYYVECPVCRGSAIVTVYSYIISENETIAILTLMCSYCGFRFRDVIPLSETDGGTCIEVYIERSIDLNTIIYMPSQVDIEMPQLDIAVEAMSLRIGSIVTVDAILQYILDSLNSVCGTAVKCREAIARLGKVVRGEAIEPTTIRIKSIYSPLRILKSYRDDNYRHC